MKEIKIGKTELNLNSPCYVIAEVGVNHNGSIRIAKKLVSIAHDSGANAVKFQSFRAQDLVTAKAAKAKYQSQNMGNNENSQYQMLKELELSLADFSELKGYCAEIGITFLSSPFDLESAIFLTRVLNVEAIKIPSGELINLPFLEQVARLGRPLILSTGMSTLGEVEEAINTIEVNGNRQIAILHCVSNYPASFESINLRVMETLDRAFPYLIGFSDHASGNDVSIAAVAMGARILEKHVTLDRNMPGPDHKASLEPDEFKALIKGIRNVELALGTSHKSPQPEELEIAKNSRKSLVASVDIPAGAILIRDYIKITRPGIGISPAQLDFVVGLQVKEAILMDEPITYNKLNPAVDK